MKNRIIAALAAASALMMVSSTASATAYNLLAWYQRSSGGTLSSLLWKAGTVNCPGPTYIQPCYDPANTSTTAAVAAVSAAAAPTFDWNGTTLTETGLFWATSAISSSPAGSTVIGDHVVDFTITPSTNTTTAAFYECVEGNFLATVGANACINVNFNTCDIPNCGYNGNGALNSTGAWPNSPNVRCVTATIGGDDYSLFDGNKGPSGGPAVAGTPKPRGVTAVAAGSAGAGCEATSGALDLFKILLDDGNVLILADVTPRAALGKCILFGPGNTDACAADFYHISVSYMVFIRAGAGVPDGDGDGVPDAIDNCPANSNASQTDLPDGDGIGDACDPDLDNDGIANGSDNCPIVANWNQADLDGDLVGDACDPNIDGDAFSNGFDADRDGDGIANASDNCPNANNPSQANADGDQLGDACDNCINVANAIPGQGPPTSSSTPDTYFIPLTAALKYQADADADGYGTICDPDFDQNNTTNVNDFNRLKARLNISPVADFPTDLDSNGSVNVNDFNRLKSRLNTAPGPSGLH